LSWRRWTRSPEEHGSPSGCDNFEEGGVGPAYVLSSALALEERPHMRSSPSVLPLFLATVSLSIPAAGLAQSLEFTFIHTAHANWLSTLVHPVAACQEVVVDSIRVQDMASTDSLELRTSRMGSVRRDAEVWWHLAGPRIEERGCGAVRAARRLDPVPDPPSTATGGSWVVGRIEAHGAGGRTDTLVPTLVDQSGTANGVFCPDLLCMGAFPEWTAYQRDSIRGTLVDRIRRNLPLLRVGARTSGSPVLEEVPLSDSAAVAGLGTTSPWNVGNHAWSEWQTVHVVEALGGTAPPTLLVPDGRRVYQWSGVGGLCCENCDTVCNLYPPGDTVAYTGGNLILSNDSTWSCFGQIDTRLASDLSRDWLILPDSAEVANGKLMATFHPYSCGGRTNAFEILNDSVDDQGVWIGLSELEEALSVGPGPVHPSLHARPVLQGWEVDWGNSSGDEASIRLSGPDGRIIFRGTTRNGQLLVPVAGHGIVFLEATRSDRTERLRLVR